MTKFPPGYLEANMSLRLRNAIRADAQCTLCGAKGHFPAECPWQPKRTIAIPKSLYDQINAL